MFRNQEVKIMKHWILTCCAFLSMLGCGAAQAQTCTVTAGSLASTTPYNPFSGTSNDTQGSFSFTCDRPPGNNGFQFPATFWVGVDNGINGSRLASGGNFLNRTLYQNYAGCSTAWGGAAGITFANANTGNGDKVTGPFAGTYCFRIPASQTGAVPSPSYSDTVTISVRSTNSAGFLWGQATFNLDTSVNAACDLPLSPTTMTINYTSFGPAQPGTSNFQLRCTNTTTYTMALDAAGGTLLDLNYTVAVSAPSGTGSGLAQAYTVDGSIAAGQSGTCNTTLCTNSQTRVLTITY
jgi:spore coat protein U-like protein